MRRRPIVLLSVAVVAALALAWASAMAQAGDQLPVVDWPCESRFVTSPASDNENTQVVWPCEVRYIELRPMVSADEGVLVEVDWPSEVRYIELRPAASTDKGVLVEVDWPSEIRFISVEDTQTAWSEQIWPSEARFTSLLPYMPGEASTMVVVWPSEARFVDRAGAGRIASATIPSAATVNKQIYRTVVEAFFGAGDAEPLYTHYPPALAQARMEEWVGWQHAFENLEATLDFQIAEGDRVLSCWTFTGLHSGDFMGIGATHKPVTFQVLYTARLINGRVVEEMGELELQPLLEQMDAVLAPRAL